MSVQIYEKSCEKMDELQADSVALTVTSPPYWNAIDYDIHAADKRKNYRTRQYANGYLEYDEYLGWLIKVFTEVFRVTKPGGLCAVVIGTVLMDGNLYAVPFDLVSKMIHGKQSWAFYQDFIWHKCTAGVKRAGVSIQKPYPGYFYPNIMNEYILLFQKPGSKLYTGRTDKEKKGAEYPINRLFTMDIANNIWHIAPVPPDTINHPAPFPEEIPFRLISLYSYPGDLILDPFLGSGQTVKVANHLERDAVGYEIIPKYAQLSRTRLKESLAIRKQQLIAVFDKVDIDQPTLNGNKVKTMKKTDLVEQMSFEIETK
ncbi:MAG: site-specific DNA-methyltransferase [Chloroflexi bacterium]|nr:site-specific DNA-methyltransferase [Chloroflexota bacterium]